MAHSAEKRRLTSRRKQERRRKGRSRQPAGLPRPACLQLPHHPGPAWQSRPASAPCVHPVRFLASLAPLWSEPARQYHVQAAVAHSSVGA